MKKNFQIIGVLVLIWFSFFCTEKTATVIKNADEIMSKINEEKEKYNTKYIDAIIVKDTIIPGKSGLIVNIDKSYEKMKRIRKYNPSLYIYDKEKPSISVDDNYDKYIIKGNSKKRKVSLIFNGTIEEVKKIYDELKNNSINVSYMLEDNKYDDLIKYTKNENIDLIMNSEIKDKYKNIYCYNSEKNKDFLQYCISNKYHSIIPTITVEDELYKKIKQNLEPGIIVFVNINNNTSYEIPTTINYLKSKGYELSNLTSLIEE